MSRVQVLDDNHLVAGCEALARGDDGPREEEFPDLPQRQFRYSRKTRRTLTLYHLGPYLALMASMFPVQLRYHLQIVPE